MSSAALTSYEALLEALTRRLDGRQIIALCGPPASGKTTLAERLANDLDQAVLLPMDGFHMDNDALAQRGRLHRKGAPDTFDVDALLDVLKRVKQGEHVQAPGFDRDMDAVVPNTHTITAHAKTVLVEGNYLLLDQPPWDALHPLWDMTVQIDVPLSELSARLMQRWLSRNHSASEANARVQGNDLPNAQTVIAQSRPADLIYRQTP
ncbi:AAA family ATPase [Nereida sp. MMG025]|uniref:AAA family ATPase n=1 Tax=Nereida sp. MMG025 TaxID=2909981 RepID=UPI001F1B6818|nr:AAA family ATPase [Nereida sp. MMG025]MCF6445583.1 AAA family ATPase [Nereida sp. MMG025]